MRPFDLLQLSIRSFEKCVTLSPHHSTTLYLLALAHYYSAANIELGYKHCVNAIILNNTDYKYWNLLGEVVVVVVVVVYLSSIKYFRINLVVKRNKAHFLDQAFLCQISEFAIRPSHLDQSRVSLLI